jgi:hypothetical protein
MPNSSNSDPSRPSPANPGQPFPPPNPPRHSLPNQPYPNQPYPNQPYPNQPYPNQPYPNQAYPGQPFPHPSWAQMSWTPPARPSPQSQVQLPAAFLMVLSVLGLMNAAFSIVQVVAFKDTMPQMLEFAARMQESAEADMERQQRRKAAEKGEEYTPRKGPDLRDINGLISSLSAQGGRYALIQGIVQLLASGAIVGGSASMMSLRYYPLAIAASVLAMLPFASPCCLFGLPLGIWSIVVLVRSDVAQAFR